MFQWMNINIVIVALMGLLHMNAAYAADIETLFMPGEVISRHAEYEADCSRCHVRFKKGTQSQLCRDCHEDIDTDISSGRGYHGRNKEIGNSSCKSCHTEHIGRNGAIVILNQATFKHGQTDFPLDGGHREVSCTSCHRPDTKYSEAPSACHDCHGKQDPHKGNLGKQCADCHTTEKWKKFDFDHDATDFPLHGKHRDVKCDSCHIDTRYKETPQNCNACHYLNDTHNGRNGSQCQDCHNSNRWDKADFDHNKKTEFALRGRHSTVACDGCHTPSLGKTKPKRDCYSCHRNDDRHRGRYGDKCQTCHSEKQWQQAHFEHARETEFPLHGKHADLICNACHRGTLADENLSSDCHSCHQADDVHAGQQGKQCQRCHQESGWSERIVFDHDLTRFPLLGLHASAPCEECHISAEYRGTEAECYACHEAVDEHKASLGPGCGQCHNPNGWALWIFDHNRQTEFELDGAHSDLHCDACHIRPVKTRVDQSSSCQACHENDDEHRGRFGRFCERCHNTESFRDVTIQ